MLDREINPIADIDTFQFNGSAGDQFRIILTGTLGSGLPCFELLAPNKTAVVPLTCGNIDLNPGPGRSPASSRSSSLNRPTIKPTHTISA